MSPTFVSPQPFVASPPPSRPIMKNNSLTSSGTFYTPPLPQTFPIAMEDSSTSAYSTPAQVLSPNQFSNEPENAGHLQDDHEVSERETFAVPPMADEHQQQVYNQEPSTNNADMQRKQLQRMIQEKLKLEEKMMIAKRKEGYRAERISKNSTNTKQNQVVSSNVKESHSVAKVESSQVEKDKNISSNVQANQRTGVKVQSAVQNEVIRQNRDVNEHENTTINTNKNDQNLITVDTNQNMVAPQKSINAQEEANRMLDRLKKTARDKIAEFQKNFALTRCVDEKEQLREANRIRDEQIRKMQEHNLDEKQKKTVAKSAYGPESDDVKQGTDLRKVKTDSKPLLPDSKASLVPLAPLSEQLLSESLGDCNSSTLRSSKSKSDKKDRKSDRKDLSEADIAKQRELKRKEDLKKLQEQFKKDQLLIQEEMRKKEAKALQQKKKLEEEATKEQEKIKEIEEKKILAQLILEEEQKLLLQKKEIEEKRKKEEIARREEVRQTEVREKIAREKENHLRSLELKEKKQTEGRTEHKQSSEVETKTKKSTKKSIRESYDTLKLKPYEMKRAEMQRAVHEQHMKSAQQLNETLKRQSYTNLDDLHIYEDISPGPAPEEKLDALRQEEVKQMQQEAKQYDEYRQHLETKRQAQMEDSDDYASEWDESSEASYRNTSKGIPGDAAHDHHEHFEELKATSEEELIEAQEKSIRNLERQIKKQKEKGRRRNSECHSSEPQNRETARTRSHKKHSQPPQRSQSERRVSASTGDLSKSSSRTLPVTKFSPDPMEFGFKPIESPCLSKSMSNLEKGGSAESGAAVAGAQAGAMATLARPTAELPASDFMASESLTKTHSMSASLGDLQQVSNVRNNVKIYYIPFILTEKK